MRVIICCHGKLIVEVQLRRLTRLRCDHGHGAADGSVAGPLLPRLLTSLYPSLSTR